MTGGARLDLPTSPYLPGLTERPDDALFEPLKVGLSPERPIAELAESPAFVGGLEAFGRGYFWEAHELWEAVWMCLPPASAERHLLRGLIQLANAGLKARMGREGAAARILRLADEAVREAFLQGHVRLMGLSPEDVAALGNRVRENGRSGDSAK